MRKLLLLTAVLVFISSALFAADPVISAFAQFDRAYIPALALTNQDKPELSKKSFDIFKNEWSILKKNYYNYNLKDDKWKTDFDSVESIILNGESVLKSGKDLKKVHEILEGVRAVFVNLRERNNIEYFIDYLNRYHETMEKTDALVSGKTAASLSSNDIKELQNEFTLLSGLWNKYISAVLDETLFKINSEKKEQIKKLTALETDSLSKLKLSLEKNDKENIISSASSLKPVYSKLFVTFGDFSNLK